MMLTVYVIPESGKNHLVSKNVPLRNDSAKAKEICTLLTHMVGVSNPSDYGLYSIVDGEGKDNYKRKKISQNTMLQKLSKCEVKA